ncbi:MAG: uncharacterized protein JWM05_1072 [Acidimicrobiales bacterium]|nr:uncharacterized protein [Acidimicrobiales bacterium]
MSGLRRWIGWLALAAVLAVALGIGSRTGTPSASQREQSLAESIRCPQCAGQSVASSETQSANAVRQLIRDGIRNGDSDQDIRDYVASRYGKQILLDPSSKGFGALVWGVPVAAAVIALAVLTLKFRGWRSSTAPEVSERDRELVEQARDRRGPRA